MLCEKYGYVPSAEDVDAFALKAESEFKSLASKENYKKCFSFMDLTSLKSNDTPQSILRFCNRVNEFAKEYPAYPLPASVCVYSNFASVVRSTLKGTGVHTTVVSACFPSSQSFLEVKVLECRMAVKAGADEVDIVLALNAFLNGDYERASLEIRSIRAAIDEEAAAQNRKVILKVILETGLIADYKLIAEASFLAMEAGADFIKTSTGKVEVNATLQAAYIMCSCIKAYQAKTGKIIGFKPAGGMSTADDALKYLYVVKSVLSDKWIDRSLFRLGVSRLGNSLLGACEGTTIKFF